MNSTEALGNGLPPQLPDESFHDYMQRLYALQGGCIRKGNENKVQARLPNGLYAQFWLYLKKRNWSLTTGVQYAVTQLLINEQC